MAHLATQDVNYAGLAAVYSAAAGGGDAFDPDDRTLLHVKNGDGSAHTVSVVTPGTAAGGLAVADVGPVAVPAGGDRFIGPFPHEDFANPAGSPAGSAAIAYSSATGMTVAVLRIQHP